MFNVKNLAAAALISLTAVAAMASNFRAADQLYLPIGGHAAGASATFATDLFVSNLTDDPVTVTMIFSAGTAGTQSTNLTPITLAAKERKELKDFFLNQPVSGFGQLIFNGCKTGADCGPATQDSSGVSPNFRNISVEARVWSFPTGSDPNASPTNGQDLTAYPWYSYVSMDQAANNLDKVFITGIRNTGSSGAGTYRTNLGIVNASQYSSTSIKITLFDSAGNALGNTTVNLQPLGVAFPVSVGGIPGAPTGPTATGLWVQVEQVSSSPTGDSPASCGSNGCPAFFAFGSVLDNVTSDATTLEAQYFKSLDYALAAIYPGSTAGKTNMRRAVHH